MKARVRGVGDQVLLVASGLLMFLGAQLHPRASLDLTFAGVEHQTLSDPRWRPVHLLILTGLVGLVIGIVWMWRRGRFGHGRLLGWFVGLLVAGGLVLWVEMGVHIAMSSEAEAVGAGASAPLFDTHVVLQAVGTPIFGAGVVGTAVLAGLGRCWGGPVLAMVGVIGGVAFGLSGLAVALVPASWNMLLFIGAVPMSAWVALCALKSIWMARRSPAQRGAVVGA